MGEELPGGGVEVVGQGAALAGDELAEQVGLEGLEVALLEELVQAVEVGRLLDDHLVLGGDVRGGADAAEAELGPAGVDLRGGHRVVDGLHVAVLLTGPGHLGHRILDLQVLVGELRGVLHAGERQGLLHESPVAGLEGGVGLEEVVVTVAHAQAALAQVEDLHVAVGEVRLDTGAEEAAFPVEVHLAEEVGEGVLRGDRMDFSDVRLDGLRAQGVAGGGVEGHLVEVRDLLVHGAGLGLERGHGLEQFVQVLPGGLRDGVEGAEAGEFGLEGVLDLPAAGGVLVEVLFRRGGGIQVRQVQGSLSTLVAGREGAKHHHKDR